MVGTAPLSSGFAIGARILDGLDRQPEPETAAAGRHIIETYTALVRFDDASTRGQAKTRSLGLGGKERPKQSVMQFLGHPRTGVGDAGLDGITIRKNIDPNRRWIGHWRSRIDGVLYQRIQHVLNSQPIDQQIGYRVWRVHAYAALGTQCQYVKGRQQLRR